MRPFEFIAPTTLPEALDLLSRQDGDTHLIAGGTDLLLQMRARTLRPRALVSLKRVPELQGIDFDPEAGLRLGSMTTLGEIVRSRSIREHYPALAQAAGLMASEGIRNLATLGGNLCNAAPSADLAPPLIVLDAEVCLSASAGDTWIPLASLFTGPGNTVLETGQILKEVRLPPPAGQSIYLRHTPRACMDIAVAGVALWLLKDGEAVQSARVALGAVAPTPIRAREAEAAMLGRSLTRKSIAGAADQAANECAPIDDVRGSAWYRRRMVSVLTRRALETLSNGSPSQGS